MSMLQGRCEPAAEHPGVCCGNAVIEPLLVLNGERPLRAAATGALDRAGGDAAPPRRARRTGARPRRAAPMGAFDSAAADLLSNGAGNGRLAESLQTRGIEVAHHRLA